MCCWVCRSPACFPSRLVMWSGVSRLWSFAAGLA
nr:MAG TPA: carboxypeptidase [Caudoviricetes sp.]